jgi:dipeptidyl-peptidase-4
MRPADSRRALLAALLALLAVPGGAEERKLTLERLHADPPLAGSLPAGLCWHPDGKRLCYLRHRTPGAPADLVAMDAGSGRETPLLSGEAVKNPTTGKALSLDAYAWSRDGERLLVAAEGDVFVVEIKTGSAHALTRTPEAEEFPQLSPDGRRVAFVRKSDLYVVDVQSGRETRLTKSGSDTVLNGRLDWVYEEELASRSGKAFWWAPDSDAVAYLQLDQARVPGFPIVDFLIAHNQVRTQRYPLAGDPNSIVRVGVVGFAKDGTPGPERLVSFAPDDVYVVPELAFTPDGGRIEVRGAPVDPRLLEVLVLLLGGDHGARRARRSGALRMRRGALSNATIGLPRKRERRGYSC